MDLELKELPIQAVLLEESLEGTPLFPGDFRGAADVSMIFREEIGQIGSFELTDSLRLGFPEENGAPPLPET